MKTDQPFIDHIAAHLDRGEFVICKICGRTATEIVAEYYKDNPPPDVPSAEALLEAARLLVYRAKVLDGTAWGEASRELHEREASSARIVADFLRSLVRP